MHSFVHHAYFSKEPTKKQPHYHDCHQILYIQNGEVTFTVDGVSHRASSGDLVIFSRYENHSLQVLSATYERFVLEIQPYAGSTNRVYALLANRPEGFRNVLSLADESAFFCDLFSRIVAESQREQPLGSQMLDLLIQELLILIYRRIPSMPVSLDDESYAYIFHLQNRFETDCRPPYSLESLAYEYNVSPSSLSHQFKKITGVPVMDYLQNCRMASAKKYLTETSKSIGEIIELCGFSDNSNFSRAFKKQNGLSPSGFRAKYR